MGYNGCPRIPYRTCEICGKQYKPLTFERAKKSRVCSRQCHGSLRKTDPELRQSSINNLPKDVAGVNNPNYKGLLTFTCVICGKKFEKSRGQSLKLVYKTCSKCLIKLGWTKREVGTKGPVRQRPFRFICVICGTEFEKSRRQSHNYKTCSKECLSVLKSQNTSGENNPVWKGGLVTIACLNCEQEFDAPPSSNRKFCSFDCRVRHWQKYPSESPGWQGGISKYAYPSEFNENYKERIHHRDNYQCQLCNLTQEEQQQKYNRNFSTHHINYLKNDLTPKNLISLCDSCHSKTHTKREYWQSHLETKIQQIYSGVET